MSTGKRLAKRSIIGTRVCAPGQDGKYYSGAICAVKAAESPGQKSVTSKTLYAVRFDITGGSPPSTKEYSDRDLIGPGFGSVTGARLVPGQKVYLTYNGREIHAEVTEHRQHLDEVDVVIAPNGQEVSTSASYIVRMCVRAHVCFGVYREFLIAGRTHICDKWSNLLLVSLECGNVRREIEIFNWKFN